MQKQDCVWLSYFGEPSIGVWKSEKHFAAAFQEPHCIRLDIERNDHSSGMTWDELREVKNQCGFADVDGIEFYPKEADIINNGNFRHLYLFDISLPIIRRIN